MLFFLLVFFCAPRLSSPLLVSSIPVVVEHDPPQVGGHQLLLLVGKAEAGQMQLAGATFRKAELPIWDEGLLEFVPVLQATRYLGGRAASLQCYNSGRMDGHELCLECIPAVCIPGAAASQVQVGQMFIAA